MAYVIFEGGGAKGYAHVGALRATEERGIAPIMVAGTSAGAIIAAMVAAGHHSSELLNPDAPVGARGLLDVDPSDLLGPVEAEEARRLQKSIEWAKETSHCKAFILAVLWWRHRVQRKRVQKELGLIGTERLEAWIDQCLQVKLGLARPVTFADLKVPLRVIAADLTTGRLREFGRSGDEDMSVAKAVAASACYPLFFQPVKVGSHMYVDGGVVSNLPAWVFDNEREDDPRFVPTFGFRLTDEQLKIKEPTAPASILSFLWRLIQTLQSGGQDLQERRIPDYFGIDLTANISTLSFEHIREKAPQLVEEGYQCVRRFYEREVGPQNPQRMARVLRAAVREMMAEYDEWRGDPRIRASILLAEPGRRWAQTTYAYNMDDDGDDRLRVKLSGMGLGTCLRVREPVYFTRPPTFRGNGEISKYEFAARPTDIQVTYAIPFFSSGEAWLEPEPARRPEPFGALVIDKFDSIDALLLDPAQQDALAHAASVVGEELQKISLTKPALDPAAPAVAEPVGFEQLDSNGLFRVSRRKLRDTRTTSLGLRISRTLSRLSEAPPKSPTSP